MVALRSGLIGVAVAVELALQLPLLIPGSTLETGLLRGNSAEEADGLGVAITDALMDAVGR